MPLMTQVYHSDGSEGLTKDSSGGSVGWSAWHLMRFADAMKLEKGLNNWDETKDVFPDEYVFTNEHLFTELETNIWDRGGEPDTNYTLHIVAGDIYRCWHGRY